MYLEATSMILAFGDTLDIKYRIDESRFDVDGTSNARYEIIKKRIDKATIKGTDERITKSGYLSIIFSSDELKNEYIRYIKFLIAKNFLQDEIQEMELEELKGVLGLTAIRVPINYKRNVDTSEIGLDYEDFAKVTH
jgi:hypothetical protein